MQPVRYNMKSDTDQEMCTIIGSCFTRFFIVLADSNNRKLKLVQSAHKGNPHNKLTAELNVLDEREFPCEVNDVCSVGGDFRAAVALDESFQFVNTSCRNAFTLEEKIDCNHHCYGIAFRNNTIYVAGKRRVYAYNMNNLQIPNLIFEGNEHSNFCKIDVSPKDGKIFIVDRDNGCIVVIQHVDGQPQGQHQPNNQSLFTIRDDSLSNIRDVRFVQGYLLALVESEDNPFVWIALENDGFSIPHDIQQPATGIHVPRSLGCSKNNTIIIGGTKQNEVIKVQLTDMLTL